MNNLKSLRTIKYIFNNIQPVLKCFVPSYIRSMMHMLEQNIFKIAQFYLTDVRFFLLFTSLLFEWFINEDIFIM